MSVEQRWRDFICSPDGYGRHLSTIGKASASTSAAPLDVSILREFLGKLRERNVSIEILADAVDLYRSQYVEFCTVDLPGLLDALANERVAELSVVGPALRGRPLWGKTVMNRRTRRIPSTHYITRIPKRSFDLPENMVVRWLVSSLARATDRLERLVGSRHVPEALRTIRASCTQALDHEWFGSVDPPALATSAMLTAARRQRHRGYRSAAAIAAQRMPREARDRTARYLAILDLLSANWLEPKATEQMFELYALVLVLDVLHIELGMGEPIEFGLVMPGRRHVAKFEKPDCSRTLVYFDQSPTSFLSTTSRYKAVLDAHEPFLGSRRRPDVTVVHERQGEQPIVVFVEVKDTADAAYTADSVYKAFGYIHDFSELWLQQAANPKVILLFPENVKLRSHISPASTEVTMVSSLDRAGLASCLSYRLLS